VVRKTSPLKIGKETFGGQKVEEAFLKALQEFFETQQGEKSSN